MPRLLDWRSFFPLLLTVASVVVPVLLWQADHPSKALKLTIRSVVQIQPQSLGPLKGVQIYIDGKPLITPFVSDLELSNTGSKPILAADFEGPLKIAVVSPAEVVKAQVGTTTPTSLEPKIDLAGGIVFVQPLLLNPSDVIQLTLVTANARPEYSVSSRIAGVASITASDAQSARVTKQYWLSKTMATLLLVIYVVNIFEFVGGIRRGHFMVWALGTALIAGFGSMFLLMMQNPVERPPIFTILTVTTLGFLVSLPILYFRIRQISKD